MNSRTISALPEAAKAIIFDCDGVLIDSWESTMHYFKCVLDRLGLGPVPKEDEDYCFVHTVRESLEHMVPSSRHHELPEALASVSVNEILDRVRRQPRISEFLAMLKAKELRLAVNTNGGGEARTVLDHLGLLGHFDMVVTSHDVEQGKPAPDGVLLILDFFGLRPEQCLFIGDSFIDQATARAAGVPFWSYGHTPLEGEGHILSYADYLPA